MTEISITKNKITEPFRRIADRIVSCQKLDIDTSRILFLLDRESPPHPYSGSSVFPISTMHRDVIYQLSGKRYDCIIKLRERNLDTMTQQQVKALLYHELRHIHIDKKSGEINISSHHDYDDWQELMEYGDWEADGESLPDVAEKKLIKDKDNEESDYS